MHRFFQIPLIILAAVSALYLVSCTFSVVNTSTEGQASDVVDSTPQTDANVSPNISVPSIPGVPAL